MSAEGTGPMTPTEFQTLALALFADPALKEGEDLKWLQDYYGAVYRAGDTISSISTLAAQRILGIRDRLNKKDEKLMSESSPANSQMTPHQFIQLARRVFSHPKFDRGGVGALWIWGRILDLVPTAAALMIPPIYVEHLQGILRNLDPPRTAPPPPADDLPAVVKDEGIYEYRLLTREELYATLGAHHHIRTQSGAFDLIGIHGTRQTGLYYFDYHGVRVTVPDHVYLRVAREPGVLRSVGLPYGLRDVVDEVEALKVECERLRVRLAEAEGRQTQWSEVSSAELAASTSGGVVEVQAATAAPPADVVAELDLVKRERDLLKNECKRRTEDVDAVIRQLRDVVGLYGPVALSGASATAVRCIEGLRKSHAAVVAKHALSQEEVLRIRSQFESFRKDGDAVRTQLTDLLANVMDVDEPMDLPQAVAAVISWTNGLRAENAGLRVTQGTVSDVLDRGETCAETLVDAARRVVAERDQLLGDVLGACERLSKVARIKGPVTFPEVVRRTVACIEGIRDEIRRGLA